MFAPTATTDLCVPVPNSSSSIEILMGNTGFTGGSTGDVGEDDTTHSRDVGGDFGGDDIGVD